MRSKRWAMTWLQHWHRAADAIASRAGFAASLRQVALKYRRALSAPWLSLSGRPITKDRNRGDLSAAMRRSAIVYLRGAHAPSKPLPTHTRCQQRGSWTFAGFASRGILPCRILRGRRVPTHADCGVLDLEHACQPERVAPGTHRIPLAAEMYLASQNLS